MHAGSLWLAILIIITSSCGHRSFPAPNPPVRCNGLVPKVTQGEYMLHDNDSYDLRMTTNVKLQMDLHHRSCFQVDIGDEQNVTSSVKSLFYVIEYQRYQETYPGRNVYQFAFPEFSSFCRCDCPGGTTFCRYDFGNRGCNRGIICGTTFIDNVNSHGCVNDGPATMCCETSVKPFNGRMFKAVSFANPTPHVTLGITIYALFDDQWVIFRNYRRSILPYRGNYLHLNGFENVADIFIFADSNKARYGLKDDFYYFELDKPFKLLENPKLVNSLHERDVNKLGWLRLDGTSWTVDNLQLYLDQIHRPEVIDCKQQRYRDRYRINSQLRVVRNSTGSIDATPFLGFDVATREPFIQDISLQLNEAKDEMDSVDVQVVHSKTSAPTLKLDLALRQKISVVSHIHTSYVKNFHVVIRLDKHSNRFLNVTLVQAYGSFLLQLFESGSSQNVDVVLAVSTNLPFSINYSDILPLPTHIRTARYACLHPVHKPKTRICKMADFNAEPMYQFELKRSFIESKGNCPGCNLEQPKSFFELLNPVNWFNGIDSVSEAIAASVELVFYILILLFIIYLIRRVIWPIAKWSCQTPPTNQMIPCSKPCEKLPV